MAIDVAPVDPAEQREKGADPKVADPIKSLLDFQSTRLKAYEQTFGTAEERRAEIDQAKAESARASGTAEAVYQNVVVPALVRQVQAARQPVPPTPEMLPQPPVPSQQARPFMDVPEQQSLGAVVQTLGLMAQLAMAGKAPVAALGALTGAMEGWHQGDRERADRQWREYLGQVDRINRTNRDNMAIFDAAMRTHTTNLQGAQAEVIAALYGHGHYEAAARVARDGVVQAYNQAADLQNHIDKVWGDTIKIIEAHETRDLRLAMERQRIELQGAWHRELIAQRDSEARQRHADAQKRFDLEERKFKHKLDEEQADVSDDSDLDDLAQQYRLGEVPSNLVRGIGKAATKKFEKIQKRAAEMDRAEGGDAAGSLMANRRNLAANTQALRALSTEQARFGAYLKSFEKTVTNARALSDKIDRTSIPKWNRFQLEMQANFQGNEDAKNLIAQMEILAREVDRVLSRGRGAAAEASRQEARQLLNPGMTKGQFDSLIKNVLNPDALYSSMGFDEERKRLQNEISKGAKATGAQAPPAAGALTPPRPGMIRVKRKSDGETGWLDRKDLGDLYQEIEQ